MRMLRYTDIRGVYQSLNGTNTVTKRDAIFPAGRQALYDIIRYSAAIRSGDLLFVSGQVGSREDGSPEPVFEKQVQLAFDNLTAVLKAAGCTFDDVVDVTTFHTDPDAVRDGRCRPNDRDRRGALSELDCGRGQLACGLRFRDQGHRAPSRSGLIDSARAGESGIVRSREAR